MNRAWLPPGLASLAVLLLTLFGAPPAGAASSIAPSPGIRENTPRVQAFINARIVVAPGRVIERGTLVARDGAIIAVGERVSVPADATTIDLTGYTLYPGFLDAAVEMGPGASGAGPFMGPRDEGGPGPAPAPETSRREPGAPYWSRFVTPQLEMSRELPGDSLSSVTARRLRSQGVTAMVAAPSKGVIKGTSAVFALTGEDVERGLVKETAALHVSFESPVPNGSEEYPQSRMGAYTLARQAFLDADWYARALAAVKSRGAPRPEVNDALAALGGWSKGARPVVIDTHDEQDALRADLFGKEFALPVVVRGSGREYRRLEEIKASGHAVLVPVAFARAPIVDSPEQALNVSLETLMHWDLGPENPGRLARAGVTIALTSDRLDDKREFLADVRKAVERGLTPDQALAALTTAPAALFGVSDRLGTLEPGKRAHLVVTDGDLFSKRTRVREVWIEGRRYDVRPRPAFDARGRWLVAATPAVSGDSLVLALEGLADSLGGTLRLGKDVKLKRAEVLERRLFLTAPFDSMKTPGAKGWARLSATVEGEAMTGEGEWPDGTRFTFTGRRVAPYAAPRDTARAAPPVARPAVDYPLGESGRATRAPVQPTAVAFTHATVWTSGPLGRLEDATVLVRGGRIAAVGRDVKVPGGAVVVDASGRHITPGLIDCHSHTASDGGINEAGQTVTAEVRIGDYIDASDIAVYRELAGGLTMAHVLHGSANAIGGQSQLIKLRWGAAPEDMKFDGFPPTIKFALGENPKQSNWGERFNTRYPQTRMGVEELIRDEFQAALEYRAAWQAGRDAFGFPPRRDLELEAVSEVLSGTRTIHCHSYRQDEILMLMRLCDEYKINVGTFQHILEGYKVADEMARRGVGGSTFSDWWAYKIEVQDAIPYNGAIMREAGVVVSFNSDSDELARRLNSEAGKAVKYGGVPPEEALKFVTINPARQLKVDKRVGSIESGKDADLALWSGDPLSARSRCEQTWIDGRKYFDREEDLAQRVVEQQTRAAIIQRILADADAAGGGAGRIARGARGDAYDGHSEEADDGNGDSAHNCGVREER